MPFSRRATEPSEEEDEVVDAVGIRSISVLRWRDGSVGLGPNLSGLASRSLRTISASASFMLAVWCN